MKTIPISEIYISPERQRKHFDPVALEDLRQDLEENGLFNAIVLRELAESTAGPVSLCLVQGERRLRAIQDLYDLGGVLRYDGEQVPSGHVPYVTLGELSPLKAEIAELHENLKRENLTWQEEAAATARIMEIRTQLAGETGTPLPSVTDIMQETKDVPRDAKSYEGAARAAYDETRQEILVAKHLQDPEVKAAKTLRDAFKVLKRKENEEKNAALAESVGRTFSASSHSILHADSIEWLLTAPEGKFDVILTDPPYGMGADEFGDSGGKAQGAHGYTDDRQTAELCVFTLAEESMRITKSQAHLYMFCDLDYFHVWRLRFEEKGWWVHRTPLIWHKTNGSRVPWPEHGPQRKYELILYAVKGKKPVNKIASDVLSYPTEENLGHAAQKPVPLLLDLLGRSVVPGAAVLDPFAGTGSLLPAAHQLKCQATLVEKEASSYGIILNRAKELK